MLHNIIIVEVEGFRRPLAVDCSHHFDFLEKH